MDQVEAFNPGMDDYQDLLQSIRKRSRMITNDDVVFRTDATDLFEIYLAGIDESTRQEYNCNTCKAFIRGYGGLVTVAENGDLIPVMWDNANYGALSKSVFDLHRRVKRSKIKSVFIRDQAGLGIHSHGGHIHFFAVLYHANMAHDKYKTCGQRMIQTAKDFCAFHDSILKFFAHDARNAIKFLKDWSIHHTQRDIELGAWLVEARSRIGVAANKNMAVNTMWKVFSSAPPRYRRFGGGNFANLIEDIKRGLPVSAIISRWNMGPSIGRS